MGNHLTVRRSIGNRIYLARFLFLILCLFASSLVHGVTLTPTVPPLNGFPPQSGTFNFSIPPGDIITAATIDGVFDVNSADIDVFVDGIAVASCAGQCPFGALAVTPVPFSYAYSQAELATLSDGVANLTVNGVGASLDFVDMQTTTLTITTVTPPTIELSSANYTTTEGATTTITVSVTGGSVTSTVSVDYATSDITATDGTDYNGVSGTLAFSPGGPTSQSFTIDTLTDSLSESNETVSITITNPQGGAILGPVNDATLTINDVALPQFQFSASSYPVNEGNAATVTVTLSGGGSGTVSVDYATSDGTASSSSDYNSASGTLNFPPGVTSQSFTVTTLSDANAETNETVNLALSNPQGGAALGSPNTSVVDISDIAPLPQVQFSAPSFTVAEGASATVTAILSFASSTPVQVSFATSDGSANAGTDYIAASGTLTFNPGVTSQTFSVNILSDNNVEGSETANLILSNPQGALLGTATSVLNITDVVTQPQVRFSAAAFSVVEGGGVTITTTLSGASPNTVSVDFASSDGSANAGSDYTAVSGTLTFNPGVTTQTFTVNTLADATREGDETFSLTLSNPQGGAVLGSPTAAVVTIGDSGSQPQIQFSTANYTIDEGGLATITASLSGASANVISVNFSTSDGSASAGSDYSGSNGTLTFNPGVTTQTFTVNTLADTSSEGDETVNLALSNPQGGAVLGSLATAVLTIIDIAPSLQLQFSSDSYSVVEGGAATITVTLTNGNQGTSPVSVDYATSAGSATSGSDYTSASGTLVFNPGDTAQTFSVSALNDNSVEGDETVSLALSNPQGGGGLGSPSVAVLTITDQPSTPLAGLPGLTGNENNVAKALDDICPQASGELLQRCNELMSPNMSDNDKVKAIRDITPSIVASQTDIFFEIGSDQMDSLQTQLTARRLGNRQRISTDVDIQVDGKTIPVKNIMLALMDGSSNDSGDPGLIEPAAGLFADERLSVFLTGKFIFQNKEDTGKEKGYEFDVKGLSFGADYRFTDELILGMATGYSYTDSDFAHDGGFMDINAVNVAVYGSYYFPGNFYLDLIGNYEIGEYDINRRIAYSGVDTAVEGDPSADQFGVSLSFGKDFYIDEWFISPYSRVEYYRTTIDSYVEQGGRGLALEYDRQRRRSLIMNIGTQINKTFSTSWGVLTPGAYIEWEHQFKDGSRAISARFVDAASGSGNFSLATDSPDRDYLNIGASLKALLPYGWSGFIAYENRVGQSDISNHTVHVGIRSEF